MTVTEETIATDTTGILANISKQRSAAAMLAENKASLEMYKRHMQAIEDSVILSGNLDGKNAETRSAQLRQALSDSERYRDMERRARDTVASIAELSAELRTLEHMLAVEYIRAGFTVTVQVRA